MKTNSEITPIDARDVALKALETFRRNKAWPEYMLKTYFKKFKIPKKDSSLAWHIVFGVIQNYLTLEYYIFKYSSMPIKKIHPIVMDILKLSAYQIIYLDKIPHSAAVNTGVDLAKKHSNPQAANFVNAILRKISDDATNNRLPKIKAETKLQRLSIEYSHSEWIVDEFIKRFGQEQATQLLKINNSVSSAMFAQVNTLRTTTDEVLDLFVNKSVGAMKHEWLDDCLCLSGVGDITTQKAFKNGYLYIQDPASRLAVLASGVKPGDIVVDACSAPGGKAFTAAIKMKNQGFINAFDKKVSKVDEIRNGASRLGIEIIRAQTKNSLKTTERLIGKADVVLADVPCSGFGIIQKNPEIRYKTQKSLKGLQDIQINILSTVSQYVKPGGVLLYSTCSILKQENEDIIETFLKDNMGFSLEGFKLPKVGNVPSGMITLLPHIHQTDGFFISKLKRVES